MITKAPFVIIEDARFSASQPAERPIVHPVLNPAGIPFEIVAVALAERKDDPTRHRRLVALDYPGRVSA